MTYPLPRVYRDDVPTRAELDAEAHSDPAGWNLSTPAETARWHALRAENLAEHAARYGVDNAQH
jgi:hypothetical protein